MRYLFALLFVVAIGMSAHGQSRSDKIPPPLDLSAPPMITAADKKLLAECGLFVARPDLRTPTLRNSISSALQERQNEWARAGDGNDNGVKGERTRIEVTCKNALGPQPTPVAPPTNVAAESPGGWVAYRPPTLVARDSPNQTPQIEPWPPPRPTDQAEYSIDRTKFKTVGEFADALLARLNDAGMHHLRFWGAPNGIAVVVPMEAIDGSAHPVKTSLMAVEQGGPLSAIVEGFLQLVSEPIRDSRVLLFVLTNDSKAKHQTVPMTPEIGREWMQNDYMRPEVNRSVSLTDQHFLLVAVYEFHK